MAADRALCQVLTAQQMRDAEQRIFDAGMPEFDLMQLAAGRVAEWVRRLAAGRSVTVLCGPGNNGGDGYVIAHCLREFGLKVTVIAPQPPKRTSARKALELWNGEVLTSGGSVQGEVFVDCLFGSGLTRKLSGEHSLLLRDLAQRHQFVIALDVPSGVASDSGKILNEHLPQSDVTLAVGAWKFAHCLLPAREKMGTRRIVPIGVNAVEAAAEQVVRPQIKPPSSTDHKYTRGLAAIVGGDMAGASLLASEAAMRAGAGYVKFLAQHVSAKPPELVVEAGDVADLLADKRINAVLIGPGLARHEGSLRAVEAALKCTGGLVLDADALHLIGPDMLDRDKPMLATPHDGELDALCRNFAVVAEGRMARAKALCARSGMVICAKGPDTIIASPDGRVAIAPPALSWLSTAGTGDVLAGIAVSRMAVGSDPFMAACEAVWLHGEAARICGPAFTPRELAHAIPSALSRCL
ncbi:MAG: NAD(P)H-hydrate dehydratase [Erythrobacter sp.]|uniref:NAD(P)H-hydrate dehydratase n=1 Tax=Erythrobacter sp. TaxID=1042 RepID=UPI0032643FF9